MESQLSSYLWIFDCVWGGVWAPNHHVAHRSPVREMCRTSESTRNKVEQWLLTWILSWTKFYSDS